MEKINIKKIIIICFFLFYTSTGFVFAEEMTQPQEVAIVEVNQEEMSLINRPITEGDIIQFQRESIWQLAMINLGYLGVCVTIILLFGGIFYFLNIRPLKEKIDTTEENLKDEIRQSISHEEKEIGKLETKTKEEIAFIKEKSLEDIEYLQSSIKAENDRLAKKIEERLNKEIGESKQKIKKLESDLSAKLLTLSQKYNTLEILMHWNAHYVWEIRKVHINAFRSLINGLEAAINYNLTFWFDLFLKEINEELDLMKQTRHLPYENEVYIKLTSMLERIKGFEKEKEEILDKARKLFVL